MQLSSGPSIGLLAMGEISNTPEIPVKSLDLLKTSQIPQTTRDKITDRSAKEFRPVR